MLTMNYQPYNQQYLGQFPQQGGQQPGFQQPGGQNLQQSGMQNTQYQQYQQQQQPQYPQQYWQGHAQQPQQYMQQAPQQPNQFYQQPQMQGTAAPQNQWAYVQQQQQIMQQQLQQQQMMQQQQQMMQQQQQHYTSPAASPVKGVIQNPVESGWNGTCIQITKEPAAAAPDSQGTFDTNEKPSRDPPSSSVESSATIDYAQEADSNASNVMHRTLYRKADTGEEDTAEEESQRGDAEIKNANLARAKRGPRKGVSHADLKQVVMKSNRQSAVSRRSPRQSRSDSGLQDDAINGTGQSASIKRGPRKGVSHADLKQVVEIVNGRSPKNSLDLDDRAHALPTRSSTQADISGRVSRANRLAAYQPVQGGTAKISTSPNLSMNDSNPVSPRRRLSPPEALASHPLYGFSDDDDE